MFLALFIFHLLIFVTTGLVTGVLIACPSGVGVALSVLGNNTSSLVGVAISASLLPPGLRMLSLFLTLRFCALLPRFYSLK